MTAERARGDVHDFAVDFSTGGDEYLATLQNIRGDAGAESIAILAFRRGEALKQAGANGGSFSEFSGAEWSRMDDVTVGIGCGGAAGQGGEGRRGRGGRVGSDLDDAVIRAVGRSAECGIDGDRLVRDLSVGLRLGLVLDRRRLDVGGMCGRGLRRRCCRLRRRAGGDRVVGRRTRSSLVDIGLASLLSSQISRERSSGYNHQSAYKNRLLHTNLHFRGLYCSNADFPDEYHPGLLDPAGDEVLHRPCRDVVSGTTYPR